MGQWSKVFFLFRINSEFKIQKYIHSSNLKLEHMSKSIILTERTISKLLKEEGKGRRQV